MPDRVRAYHTRMPSLPVCLLLLALLACLSWYALPLFWARLLSGGLRRWRGCRSRRLVLDGISWHFLEGGQSRGKAPTLVLLHGLAAEADHWLLAVPHLADRYHLLIPDLPGFGASEPPATLDFHLEAQAERVLAWLDALGISEYLLAGNSMGGGIAAQCAVRQAERVRTLWLLDPLGVASARPSELQTRLANGENLFIVNSLADYRKLLRVMFTRPLFVPYPLLAAGARLTARLVDLVPRLQRELLEESQTLEQLAPELALPVLVQWGADDRALDVSGAQVLADLLPQAEVDVIPGVGHLPFMECPRRSCQGFLDFIDRLD